MTQITKEAIEAAWAAYQKFGWSTQEGMGKAIESALPFLPIAGKPDMLRLAVAAVLEADKEFRANMPPEWEGDPLSDEIDGLRRVFSFNLPIAGEGKVKALEWIGDEGAPGFDVYAEPDPYHRYTVRHLGEGRFDVILNTDTGSIWFAQVNDGVIHPTYTAAKASAQTDYETRILSALISSPGTDIERCARLIEENIIKDTSGGKILAPRQDGNRDGLFYATAIRALSPSSPGKDGGQEVEAVAWPIATNDQVEDLARECGWDNRKYMTPKDYSIWCERMRKFARLAAPPAPDGWQPIETAPKDGTEILAYGYARCDGSRYANGQHIAWWDAELGWTGRDPDDRVTLHLSHWRPLPPRPELGGE